MLISNAACRYAQSADRMHSISACAVTTPKLRTLADTSDIPATSIPRSPGPNVVVNCRIMEPSTSYLTNKVPPLGYLRRQTAVVAQQSRSRCGSRTCPYRITSGASSLRASSLHTKQDNKFMQSHIPLDRPVHRAAHATPIYTTLTHLLDTSASLTLLTIAMGAYRGTLVDTPALGELRVRLDHVIGALVILHLLLFSVFLRIALLALAAHHVSPSHALPFSRRRFSQSRPAPSSILLSCPC